MTIEITDGTVTVRPSAGERLPRSEGEFWHALKLSLNNGARVGAWLRPLGGRVPGLNSIPHALRERSSGRYIFDDAYAVRLAHVSYRERGQLELSVTM